MTLVVPVAAALPAFRGIVPSRRRAPCRHTSRVEAKAACAAPGPVGWKGDTLTHSSLPLLPSGKRKP